jgi:3-oxoacyl-[acyl-carrier-protein] synthase III
VYLIAAGHCIPETTLDNDFLDKLTLKGIAGSSSSESLNATSLGFFSDIVTRRSILKRDYLLETANKTLSESSRNSVISPTELGANALRSALNKASIDPSNVQTVLADTGTPMQTIPSEAQRVCGSMAMKYTSYDVIGIAAGMALHLEYLMMRKPETLPEYTAILSTNVPTACLHYSLCCKEARILGDASVCFILSPHEERGYRVVDAVAYTKIDANQLCSLPVYKPISVSDANAYADFIFEKSVYVLHEAIRKHKLASSKLKVFGPVPKGNASKKLAFQTKIFDERYYSTVGTHGDSLGSTTPLGFSCFTEIEDISYDDVLLIFAGAGLSYGYILLSKV